MLSRHDSVEEWTSSFPVAKNWQSWLDDHGPRQPCQCKGFGPLPEQFLDFVLFEDNIGFWEYISRLDTFAAVSSSIINVGGISRFVRGGVLGYLMEHILDAVMDCAAGAATLLLMGLDTIETVFGFPETQRWFSISVALMSHARRFPCHLEFDILRPSYSGSTFVPYFTRLPFLLDMETPPLACAAGAPRIYVYELEPRWTPDPMLTCAKGLAATDVWLHRQLLRSSCREHSAQRADLLYVPLYSRCLYAQKHNIQDQGYSWEHPFANATEWYIDLLGSLSFFKVRPQDHIFLFPEEHWPVPRQVFATGGLLGSSVIISPEARPVHCDESFLEVWGHSCMHLPQRDRGMVVIPSFVDSWRVQRLRERRRPFDRRELLASFMGLGVTKGYAMTENYRHLLNVLAKVPGFWVGGYSEHYEEVLGNSVFCLVPKGVGTWSHRLFEAMLAGCIPVILSDDAWLPFPDLPWESFSVKWPMRQVDNRTLPFLLRSMLLPPDFEAWALKENVDRYACWFDYHSELDDCSPLHGVTGQLRKPLGDPGPKGFWPGFEWHEAPTSELP